MVLTFSQLKNAILGPSPRSELRLAVHRQNFISVMWLLLSTLWYEPRPTPVMPSASHPEGAGSIRAGSLFQIQTRPILPNRDFVLDVVHVTHWVACKLGNLLGARQIGLAAAERTLKPPQVSVR